MMMNRNDNNFPAEGLMSSRSNRIAGLVAAPAQSKSGRRLPLCLWIVQISGVYSDIDLDLIIYGCDTRSGPRRILRFLLFGPGSYLST